MTGHDKLREAIDYVRGCKANMVMMNEAGHDKFDIVIAAAKLALPKTKMVEVWHVHYAHRPSGGWQAEVETRYSEREAGWRAARLRELPAEFACIRVTGPHQQEVPA